MNIFPLFCNNKQYKTNYIAVMPCNLYGINDNYHKENAHVIPMLIRRFHEAKINKDKEEVYLRNKRIFAIRTYSSKYSIHHNL